MSVTVVPTIAGPYIPNGATVAFAFDFKIADPSEISVIQVLNGAETEIAADQYSVTIASDGEGGTVIFFTPPLTGSGSVYLISDPSFEQTAAFTTDGPFTLKSLTNIADRSAIRDLRLKALLDRAPLVPWGETAGLIPPKAQRAGMFQTWDADGNPAFASGAGADAALRTDLAASSGAGLVGFIRNAVGAVARSIQDIFRSLFAFSPEDFGATGDGVADDYTAFQNMIAAVNAAGGGTIKFGRGKTYFIGQYVIAGNGIADLTFTGCNGLVIDGNGAKIDLKGNFDRAASTTRGLQCVFANCSNVVLRNYEIDGNVDQMTNSSNSAEATCYGVNLQGCTGVIIDNVHAHDFATDAFRCQSFFNGANQIACRRVTMSNCRAEFNARLAISLIQVRGFVARNCTFSQTAQYAGGYLFGGLKGHAPKRGVDIEPNYTTATPSPNAADINTGEILFERCRFINNDAGSWAASLPSAIDTVTFRSCRMEGSTTRTDDVDIILDVPGCTVEDCYIDLKANFMNFCHITDSRVTGRFVGNKVHGTNCLMQSVQPSGRCYVGYNEFILDNTGTYAPASALNALNLQNPGLIFEHNRFFAPQAAWGAGGAGDSKKIANVGAIRRSIRNRFETDLTATFGGAASAHFYVDYQAASAEVVEDKFAGTAAGIADTFRPAAQSTFNTAYPFNRNRPGQRGAPGTRVLTDAAATHTHTIDPATAELAAPLTADRTITLSATNAVAGAQLEVVRTGASTGAFNLIVGGLKSLATGQWAKVRHDGTAWKLIAFGSL